MPSIDIWSGYPGTGVPELSKRGRIDGARIEFKSVAKIAIQDLGALRTVSIVSAIAVRRLVFRPEV